MGVGDYNPQDSETRASQLCKERSRMYGQNEIRMVLKMATYTTRTCKFCGIRRPQPEMNQIQARTQVGESRSSATVSTFFGALMDDKKSKRAVSNSLFNTNSRKHYRSQMIWFCDSADCGKLSKALAVNSAAAQIGWVWPLIIVSFFVFFGFGSKDKASQTDEAEAPFENGAQDGEGNLLRSGVAPIPLNSVPVVTDQFSTTNQLTTDAAVLNAIEGEIETDKPTSPNHLFVMPSKELALIENAFKTAHPKAREDLQRELSARGRYAGKIDGKWGAGTRAGFVEAWAKYLEQYPGVAINKPEDVFAFFDAITFEGL